MSYIPRAMTNEEKALIRTDQQFSSLYLGFLKPSVVFSAVVNQSFTSRDKVVEVEYDSPTGDIADVIPGMTVWIGSTPGASDRGQCRVRLAPDSSKLYVGENSDVLWAEDIHLSVVDDFDIWARYLAIAANVPYMDHGIAYTDQHTHTNPIPCIGPRLVPVWISSGGTVDVPFDASDSWTLPDTSVSAFVWEAPGCSAATGQLTATPTFTYDAPGTYRVSCKVYSANGNNTTAYAHVLVFDPILAPPVTQFQLKSVSGAHAENGWKFQVTMWDQVSLGDVIDRAHVVLFARDWYDGTSEVSIGEIPDRENIICIGRINGQSIIEDPDASSVTFTVESSTASLKRTSNFPVGIANNTRASSAWTNWFNLTVDMSLYHLFFWQSTVIPALDVYLTGDTRKSQEQYAAGDMSIFDQINLLLKNTLLGQAGCDRFNRLFCEIDTQLISVPSRTPFEVILTLEKYDWRDQMGIDRITVPTTSQVNLSGVVINPPKEPKPIFSLAPGHVYTHLGKPAKQDKLLLSTQADSNDLAARMLAWSNHEYEFSIDLAGNNRMLDVFPTHQYVRIIVEEEDTPRDFLFNGNVIVREIQMSQTPAGFLQISWRGENETFPGNSCDGDLPEISEVPTEGVPVDPPPEDPEEPVLTPNPETIENVAVLIPGTGIFYTNNFASEPSDVEWFSMTDGFPDPEVYPPLIYAFEVSQSGRFFCQVGYDSIWSAPGAGQPWVKVFDTTMIGNPESYPFPRYPKVIAFGIDRDSDDELLIIAGLTVTIFSSFIMYTWRGSSSGVTQATPVFFNDAAQSGSLLPGLINYADGTWVAFYNSGAFTGVMTSIKFDESGLVASTAFQMTSTSLTATRSRYSPATLLAANLPSNFISTDNGSNFSTLPTAPQGYPNTESMVTNSDGTIILIGTQYTGLKRSIDGGATWEPTSTLAAVPSIWNLGTDEDWLFAFVGQIVYTPDAGDTFYYHTGDLQTYAGPFFIISQIRYF